MSDNLSRNRLVRNEQIIRNRNTEAINGIKKYFQHDKKVKDAPLEFVCECSAIDCAEKVTMTINEYERIHSRKDLFAIAAGHQTPSIEEVLVSRDDYSVVEKEELSAQ